MNTSADIAMRHRIEPEDRDRVRQIVESTAMFRPDEVGVAVELVDERLAKGEASGYHFAFAERAGEVAGYACFGPIACTIASFDLYWIAVARTCRGGGWDGGWSRRPSGKSALGGQRIYIDTSGRPQYEPTRRFYERCGYAVQAVLPEFYAPGDDRVIFFKRLG